MVNVKWKKLVAAASLITLGGALLAPVHQVQAADESWDRIQKSGKIVVATSGAYYPSTFHSEVEGKDVLTGYDIEILRKVAEKLDLELEFKEMNTDGMLTAIKSGQADIVANDYDITPKREKEFLFSTPIKYSFGSIVVRESDDSGIKSLDDFKGKKAAGEATTKYMAIAEAKGAEAVTYDNGTLEQYIADIHNGRTDFIPNDYYVQTIAIKNANKLFPDFKTKVGNVFYNPSKAAFVLNKESVTLQEKINQVLEEMRKDGSLAELSKKFYEGEDVSTEKEEIGGKKLKDLPVVEVDR